MNADVKPSSPPVHLYQVVYTPEALASIEPGYLVLDNLANERPDWREYWPIRHFLLSNALDEDAFYGFFSPKFGAKTLVGPTQAAAFVRANAHQADVVLFSPQPDMSAFFLNVFEQGELFDPGLIDAYEAFLMHIGRPVALGQLIMDSGQTVFSNYFAARPAFWIAWLAINEALFTVCESSNANLQKALCQTTTYPGAVQRKVFLIERAASLLIVTDTKWRSVAYNPFGMGWSTSRFREYPTDAVISDALKIAFRDRRYPQYMEAFAAVRERFRVG